MNCQIPSAFSVASSSGDVSTSNSSEARIALPAATKCIGSKNEFLLTLEFLSIHRLKATLQFCTFCSILFSFSLGPLVSADGAKTLREGNAKPCFLFSWGKGPNWVTDTTTEFQLAHFNLWQPYVDDTISEPSSDALNWHNKQADAVINIIARVNGRQIAKIHYPITAAFGRDKDFVMLSLETEKDSGWFSPFFAANPELYDDQIISSKQIPFGCIATLSFSGTGAIRTHHLFDLTGDHPRLIAKSTAGRVRRIDYDNEDDYKKALLTFEYEEKLLNGEPDPATRLKQ